MALPKKYGIGVPELGLFYGDQGGPGTSLPASDAHKLCPFLEGKDKVFCSLDGALCPFLGFNYRRCKKYTNNMAKGTLMANDRVSSTSKPPRMEALTEAAKKGGSASDEEITKALDSLGRENPRAAAMAGFALQLGVFADEGADPAALKQDREMMFRELVDTGMVVIPVRKTPPPNERVKDRDVREKHERLKVKAQRNQLTQQRRLIDTYLRRVLGSKSDSGRLSNTMAMADALFAMANSEVKQGIMDTMWHQTRQDNMQHHRAGDTEDLIHGKYPDHMKNDTATSASTEEPDNRPHEPRKGPKSGRDSSSTPPKGHPGFGPNPSGSRAGESEAKAKNTRDSYAKADTHQTYRQAKTKFKVKKAPKKRRQTTKSTATKRHFSGFAQTSTKVRTAEQFDTWIDEQQRLRSPETLAAVFRGQGKDVKGNIDFLKTSAETFYKKNNVRDIADLHKGLQKRLDDFDDIGHKKRMFELQFAENKRRAHMLDPDLDDKLKAWRSDPERLGKIARLQNKAARRFYKLEHQKIKIGNMEVMTTLRKATMPTLSRADYEVIRMSEQLGLAAIQKQHQYGRKYGKFNSWGLFAKSVVGPVLLLLTGHAEYIVPVLRAWPQAWLDSFFFSYMDKPLPKYKGKETGMVMSRDDKSMISQRMVSGRSKKLMKGFDKDYVMPPDRAVMHTQWRPTTKKRWSKIRHKELAKRFQATKIKPPAGAGETWRRGFLRR